ncbi:ABC transporter substrate-binding protein [Paenibacillus sp. UNC451MF]|uniref:ABC transporter substrate-binding protein n=1 Tax=Paenibacillus sp. UNC451MF TaxID=1449063 RepID=UPI000491882E|nr:extracellular solute-binding protein [Paenibacillus sp. UNC451MF]
MVRSFGLLLIAVWIVLTTAGCTPTEGSNSKERGMEQESSLKPVNLKVLGIITFSDEQWDNIFVKPIQKKFPNVTLERLNEKNYRERLTSGYVPDLLITSYASIPDLIELKVAGDIGPMMQKYKFDGTNFDKPVMDMFKSFPSFQFAGLPMYKNPKVMFYNKDIFDRFGVPYPTDNMTWEQAVELARKLTVTDEGIPYMGLQPGGLSHLAGQLSLLQVDPKTNKAAVNSDDYQRLFQFLKQIQTIPGMDLGKANSDAFFKNRTLAMYDYWTTDGLIPLEEAHKTGNPLNWDLVTSPMFADKPGIHSMTDVHVMLMSEMSEHKDLVYQIMSYIASSEEVQSEFAKIGRAPVLRSDKVFQHFGENFASVKGKNLEAIFKTGFAPRPAPSAYEGLASKPVNDALSRVLSGSEDINTALRKAEEEANKNIETAATAK